MVTRFICEILNQDTRLKEKNLTNGEKDFKKEGLNIPYKKAEVSFLTMKDKN
jgi:hypothetical protein